MRRAWIALLAWRLTLLGQSAPTADTILVNGRVITVNASDDVAEAVAIRSGTIVAVGTREAVMRRAGRGTKIIDLHGQTATPGLIDSHLHFATVEPVYAINLSGVRDMGEVKRLVAARVKKSKPGEWIQGQGWDEGKLAEHRYIQASDLDEVAPRNPVWLMHTTGHYAVANSMALRAAAIADASKNPAAGTIDRDGQGKITGVLKEAAAMALVQAHIPEYSHEQMREGHIKMMSEFNQEGITALKDPGITESDWRIYSELRDDRKLSTHVFALWRGGTTMASAQEAIGHVLAIRQQGSKGDDLLMCGGIKLFMDGSGGARTAWMTQDWNKQFKETDTGNRGYPLTDPAIYRQQVKAIHKAGIHVGTHAIGDQAIDWVVDTYTQVLRDKPVRGLRHSIIHANIPSDHAIAGMKALQQEYDAGYPEAQAEFMYWLGDTYAANFGPVRCLRLMPFGTYIKEGIIWAGGSDFPVTPFAPRLGIWASMARTTLRGTYGWQPFGTSEAVDVHAALRSYTIWAARQVFLDKRIGSLEPGKEADIAVWDRDPYSVPVDQVKDMKCTMTLLQGRLVYETAAK